MVKKPSNLADICLNMLMYTLFCIKIKNFFYFFKKWLQLVQILELLYTNTYSLKFVSFVRIQLDTKDTNV